MSTPTVVTLSKKSTNGRFLLKLLRAEFRLLGRLVPALSDRRASALFFTPRRRPRPPEPGTPGRVASPFHVVSGAFRLAAWSWGEGPTVVLAHGWNGSASQMSSFLRPLLDAGFRVVAFEQPAHGHSSGRRATLLDMAAALQSVVRAVGPVHAVVAHSLGATSAALALFDNLPAGRAVLIAPAAAPEHFIGRLAAHLGLSARRAEGMQRQVQREVGVHLTALDIRGFAPWMRMQALIFHDVADREVPFAHGRAIAEAWPRARFVPLQRLGHIRPLADAEVLSTTVAFLREGVTAATRTEGRATSG